MDRRAAFRVLWIETATLRIADQVSLEASKYPTALAEFDRRSGIGNQGVREPAKALARTQLVRARWKLLSAFGKISGRGLLNVIEPLLLSLLYRVASKSKTSLSVVAIPGAWRCRSLVCKY